VKRPPANFNLRREFCDSVPAGDAEWQTGQGDPTTLKPELDGRVLVFTRYHR
jgi:hypothetical protein